MRKVRLKAKYGKYLALTSSVFSFIIKEGGENDPSGFEVDEATYERIREYVEPVSQPLPTKRRKSETKEIVNLEE